MQVVSENSEVDLVRKRAVMDAQHAVRQLAACLMRIVAGAGKSYEIERHALDLLNACNTYYGTDPRNGISYDLGQALDITIDLFGANLNEHEIEWTHGLQLVREGALRMAAAELLGQRVQVANGKNRMFDGIRIIDEEREKNRARAHQAAQAKRLASRPRRQPKP